jgi:hypothetical protein
MGKQDGQSTLEWVITAAVVLGRVASQRDYFPAPGPQFNFRLARTLIAEKKPRFALNRPAARSAQASTA